MDSTVVDAADQSTRGWYLYGITRRGNLAEVLTEADGARVAGSAPDDGSSDVAPLELLECYGLAAVVRSVRLADFTPDLLRERLRNAGDIEAMVRNHNRIVEEIHARQAILPARFGMVYADAQEILSALRAGCDTLLPRLHRLTACDEWAVHVHADRALVRQHAAARIPALAQLRQEHAAARPGRAFFLERQLRGELEDATREAMSQLAQRTFDQLSRSAVAGEVTPVRTAADSAAEVEILRAAFLVARDAFEAFDSAVQSVMDSGEGLRCEYSGPWPPYSFALWGAEEAT